MLNNYPIVLEGYYKIGETISRSKIIRETDLMAFEKVEKEKTNFVS